MRCTCFPELGGSTFLGKHCATGRREDNGFRCLGKVSLLPDADLAPLRSRELPTFLDAGSPTFQRAVTEFKTVTGPYTGSGQGESWLLLPRLLLELLALRDNTPGIAQIPHAWFLLHWQEEVTLAPLQSKHRFPLKFDLFKKRN